MSVTTNVKEIQKITRFLKSGILPGTFTVLFARQDMAYTNHIQDVVYYFENDGTFYCLHHGELIQYPKEYWTRNRSESVVTDEIWVQCTPTHEV